MNNNIIFSNLIFPDYEIDEIWMKGNNKMEQYRKMCCNCEHSLVNVCSGNKDYDDYLIYECELNNENINAFDDACDKYKKYATKPHKEQHTICDNCSNLKTCMENGSVYDVTAILDSMRHFIPAIGASCRKR